MRRPVHSVPRPRRRLLSCVLAAALLVPGLAGAVPLELNELEYFHKRGLDVLAFNNYYDGLFSDAKHAGVELIHHGVRTATNGDVRLSPTPEQWDPVALMVDRKVDRRTGTVTTRLGYADHGFEYDIRVAPAGEGVRIQVVLDRPLPRSLQGKAGFNLEFLPSAYWGKSWVTDTGSGQLPLYPAGPTARGDDGKPVRLPMATGRSLTLARKIRSAGSRSGRRPANRHLRRRNQARTAGTWSRACCRGPASEWTLEASTVPAGRARP